MSWWETAIETLRGKPTQAPAPFDRQANATAPLMGPSDIIPEAVTQATGSDLAGIAAGFLSPTSMLRKPMRSDAITKGGDPNLLLTHTSSLRGMLDTLRGVSHKQAYRTPTLVSPSMAIARVPEPYSPGIELYMQPSKFDPAVTRRADLWPVDAYTYRSDPLEPTRYAQQAKLRKHAKLSEGYQPDSISHLMAVLTAPNFESFKAFEKSPKGAGRIIDRYASYDGFDTPYTAKLTAGFYNWLAKQPDSYKLAQNLEPDYVPFLTQYLRENPAVVSKAQVLPSQYGELKYHGGVPLTPEYVAAARIAPNVLDDADEDDIRSLKQLLARQQIPVMRGVLSQPAIQQEQIAEYIDQLTGLRGQRRYPR
jgi:hypothetical protein